MPLRSHESDDLAESQHDRIQQVLTLLDRRRDGRPDFIPHGLLALEHVQAARENAKVPREPVGEAGEEALGAVERAAEVVVEPALEEAVELG